MERFLTLFSLLFQQYIFHCYELFLLQTNTKDDVRRTSSPSSVAEPVRLSIICKLE